MTEYKHYPHEYDEIKSSYQVEMFKRRFNRYQDDPMFVYNMCYNEWLVIMMKLTSGEIKTSTDESRSVHDKSYAKFQADILHVCKIINIHNNSMITRLQSDSNPLITYQVGKSLYMGNDIDIDENNNGIDLDNHLSINDGIDYFATLDRVFFNRSVPASHTGVWVEWYDDGQKKEIGMYISGKKYGKFTSFYDTGLKQYKCNYSNGLMDGELTYWNKYYGTVQEMITYKNGKKNGLYIEYHQILENDRDIISTKGYYEDNKKVGLWTQYNIDGTLKN